MRENATSPACLAASTAVAKNSTGEPETDISHQPKKKDTGSVNVCVNNKEQNMYGSCHSEPLILKE